MQDEEFQTLLNAKAPLVLIGSRRKFLLYFFGSTLLAVFSVIVLFSLDLALDKQVIGALGVLFFGYCAVSNWRSIISPETYSLTLANDQFIVRAMKNSRTYRWKDVSEFVVDRFGIKPSTKMVFFNDGSVVEEVYDEEEDSSDYNNCLMTFYGNLNSTQLAQLMNHWRNRAISTNTLP